MLFCSFKGRHFASAAFVGLMLAIAGCQSDGGGVLGVGGDKQVNTAESQTQPQPGKVSASSLRAYCPKITLREGTAYFNTYTDGGRRSAADGENPGGDDSGNIVYQAAITDVTRDCTHGGGTMTLNVAVAGKIVPGPQAKPGTITMPIRIVVMRGTEVLYSELHQHKVQVSDMTAATQFVFNDPAIAVPEPTAANYRVYAGYDEGPPAQPKPRKPRVVRKKAPATATAPAQKPASGNQTSISDIPR